jgi:hypothetical protein
MELFPKCSEIEEALVAATKQGGTAESAISAVMEMIDSMINRNLFFCRTLVSLGRNG